MKSLWRASFVARICVGLVATLLIAHSARADFLGNLVQVNVSSGALTGSWVLDVPADSDPFDWYLSSPVDIYSTQQPGTLLATLEGLSLGLDGDPQVLLNFAVTAGAANTNFSITSAVVAFAPLVNPPSFATAGITVTDNNGNGGSATGAFAGTKSYEAHYNGASIFSDLVSPVIALPNNTNTGSENFGSVPIPGAVTSIQSEFRFTLSARDSASGTSRFSVVPEPSSMALGVLAGLALVALRRRRK